MPNAQVLKMTKEFYVEPAEVIFCLMECHSITMADVKALMEDGDVNFGDSQPKCPEKEYIITHETPDGRDFTTHWFIEELAVDKKRAKLIKIYPDESTTCDC